MVQFFLRKDQKPVIYSFQVTEHLKSETIPHSQWHLSSYRKRIEDQKELKKFLSSLSTKLPFRSWL